MPRTDQGVTLDRYMVIPRCLIFITRGEEVLLLKGSPGKRLWANRYNGIGGHIEQGEDILQAARRELKEETGLALQDLWFCGQIMVDTDKAVGISMFLFRGEWSGGELAPSDEGALEWVTLERLGALPLVEDLPYLIPRVIGMCPGDPPLIGRTWYDENDRMVVRFR